MPFVLTGRSVRFLYALPAVLAPFEFNSDPTAVSLLLSTVMLCISMLLLLSGDIESNPGPNIAKACIEGLLINARSIKNKIPQLQATLQLNKIDFVAVTETWLNAAVKNSELLDSSYQIYRKDRSDRRGGGILLAFKSWLKITLREDLIPSSTDHNEILVVDILCHNLGKICIVLCYRPPNDFSDEFISNLKTTLHRCSDANFNNLCLLGDLNMPNINWHRMVSSRLSSFDTEICNMFLELNLFQSNFNPSTIHGNTLDVILSTFPQRITNVRCEEDIIDSDHYSLFFTLAVKVDSKSSVANRIVYDYKRTNFIDLNSRISMSELDTLCDQYSNDIDRLVLMWTSKVISYIDAFVPKIKAKNLASQPWINSELKHLSNRKETARQKAKKGNSDKLWEKYRHYRNLLKTAVSNNYNRYLSREASEISQNPKRAWNLIHKRTKTKRLPNIMQLDDKVASTTKQVADLFNEYFYSTFTPMDHSLVVPHINVLRNQDLSNVIFTPCDILIVLKNLNPTKASGHDGLDARILKECASVLAPSLTRIFNYSFKLCKFPTSWKLANVIPVHKSGNLQDVKNYRPISLTCVVSKVFERCVYNKISPLLIEQIHYLQHGFMKGLSTTTQLLQVYDEINSIIDNRGQVDTLFLDFSKAFDSIPHDLLIHKIQAFGIYGKLHQWLKDYLCNRQQRVIIENETSHFVPVLSGVPQGSILGPLLFLLYINDLPSCISCSTKMALYADDAKMYRQIASLNDCLSLQSDLDNVNRWSKSWQLKFNLKKCSVITFSRKRSNIHFYYNMSGFPLKHESSIKDLGVTVECDLSWNQHIVSVVRKAYNVLWFLKRTLRNSVSASVKTIFYSSLVRPHLEYGSPVWSVITKKNLNFLEQVQKSATKFLIGYNNNNIDYKSRLKICDLLPLSYRREFLDINFLYKCIHNKTLSIILDKISFSGRRGKLLINDVNLGLLLIQNANSEIYKHFYSHRIVPVWNGVPCEIRSIEFGTNGAKFKKHLSNYFRKKFNETFDTHNMCTWVSKCRCFSCR